LAHPVYASVTNQYNLVSAIDRHKASSNLIESKSSLQPGYTAFGHLWADCLGLGLI